MEKNKEKKLYIGILFCFAIVIIGVVIAALFLKKDNGKSDNSSANEVAQENNVDEKKEEDNNDVLDEEILVEEINISGEKSVKVNEVITLNVSYTPDNASNKEVNWESLNTSIATVDLNGIVKGLKAGKVVIKATLKDGSKSKEYEVTVIDKEETTNNKKVNKKEETKNSEKITCDTKLKSGKSPEKISNFIEYQTEKTTINTKDVKYGVKINTVETKKYAVFSDADKCLYKTSQKEEYDTSGFKAASKELEPEATDLYNKYKNELNEELSFVNTYRSEVLASNLVIDQKLSILATIRALEIGYANNFSHTRPDGRSCFSVVDDYNISYGAIGENIAYGASSAKSVSEMWKNSPGHYSNIINSDYTKIGIGKAVVNNTTYWVQIFLG